MLFRKNKPKVDVSIETLKLRIEMVDYLLRYRFTWEEIYRGLGFSEEWYAFTKKMIEKKNNRPMRNGANKPFSFCPVREINTSYYDKQYII